MMPASINPEPNVNVKTCKNRSQALASAVLRLSLPDNVIESSIFDRLFEVTSKDISFSWKKDVFSAKTITEGMYFFIKQLFYQSDKP